jgi:hypothetical protein
VNCIHCGKRPAVGGDGWTRFWCRACMRPWSDDPAPVGGPVAEPCERCGKYPAMQRGLRGACLGRELS